MSYSELKKAVAAATGLTRQGVEYRARQLKASAGPMRTEHAIAILAHDEKIDIAEYLEPEEVLRVNQLVVQRAILDSPQARARATGSARKVINVSIAERLELSDPLLPARALQDAREMAGVYAELYVFENSVREVVKRVLSNQSGDNWWRTCVPAKIQRDAQNRIDDEKKNPWHGRRGAHPIYYTDMPDLSSIVVKNWSAFEELFPGQSWITQKITEIARSRNVVNHHNPLSKQDRKRIQLYSTDWHQQIQSLKGILS
jgi:hypothetical protein